MKSLKLFFLLLLSAPMAVFAQQVDFGIFESAQAGKIEVRIRPDFACDLYLTNMQYTLKWPVASGATITPGPLVPPYNLIAQGLYQDNGYNYYVFATSGGNTVSWMADSSYVCATFTYDSVDCYDFEIAQDAWTLANNYSTG